MKNKIIHAWHGHERELYILLEDGRMFRWNYVYDFWDRVSYPDIPEYSEEYEKRFRKMMKGQ